MPNIPDSRAPATVRFELPDENIGAVTKGLSRLAKAVHEKDKKKKEEEKARKQEPATADVDPAESPQDESVIEGVKSDLRDASEYMQEKLRDIDLYEEMSEFASGLYQGIKEQLGFTDSSPSKIDEEINSAYANIKTDLMTRQNFKGEDEAAAFSQRFDEKARFDQQSLRAFKQEIIKEKIHTTVDRHIEKYGSGVVGNPDTLTDAIIVIDSNINDLAPGIGREAAVEKSREARRSLLSFALQGHAKQGNYDALQSLLDGVDPATGAAINIDEYVNREDKGYFQSIASKGIVRNEATRLLDDIYSAGLSEEDLLRTLEYYPDQLVGEEAALLWRNERRLQAKEQRERVKGQRYFAWNFLVENKGNIDINDLSLDLSQSDRNQIAEYADQIIAGDNDFSPDVKFRREQGSRALYELKALQVADPEAFPNYDLSHYFKDLSPKQINEVIAMQQSEPDPRLAANFKLRERLAQRAWESITGSDGQGELDRHAFVDFRIRLDERIDEYNGTQKEPAGPFEIEQIVNDMVANGEVVQPVQGNEVIRGEEERDVLVGDGDPVFAEDVIKGTHEWYEFLADLRSSNPDEFSKLPIKDQKASTAYWMHNRGGTTGTSVTAIAQTKEHRQQSLIAGNNVLYQEDVLSWEKDVTEELIRNTGIDKGLATDIATVISFTPVGSALDIGEGLLNASVAFEQGDIEKGLGYLGEAGMSALKINKLKKLFVKSGVKAQRIISDALPDLAARKMFKALSKQGLSSGVVKDSIFRAFRNGFNPGEALAYGVFSANAKKVIDSAFQAFKGEILSENKQRIIREKIESVLYREGSKFLKDVSEKAKSKAVKTLIDEWFENSKLQ
ncbi:hypothetical protein [Kiloniella sp. EL199]|uniref:hypothetical protein n=1 Tax=Kiloniella sp. EL199 TaxID=2107581 RepID=UPI000EA0907B|nr:hypothetical protein [Kiloniella sp. EL199]